MPPSVLVKQPASLSEHVYLCLNGAGGVGAVVCTEKVLGGAIENDTLPVWPPFAAFGTAIITNLILVLSFLPGLFWSRVYPRYSEVKSIEMYISNTALPKKCPSPQDGVSSVSKSVCQAMMSCPRAQNAIGCNSALNTDATLPVQRLAPRSTHRTADRRELIVRVRSYRANDSPAACSTESKSGAGERSHGLASRAAAPAKHGPQELLDSAGVP